MPAASAAEPSRTDDTFAPGPAWSKAGTVPRLTRRPVDAGFAGCSPPPVSRVEVSGSGRCVR